MVQDQFERRREKSSAIRGNTDFAAFLVQCLPCCYSFLLAQSDSSAEGKHEPHQHIGLCFQQALAPFRLLCEQPLTSFRSLCKFSISLGKNSPSVTPSKPFDLH